MRREHYFESFGKFCQFIAHTTRVEVLTLFYDRLDQKLVCFDDLDRKKSNHRARPKKDIFRSCSTKKK